MEAYVSSCPHGFAAVALCAICTNLGKHFITISNCSHSWSKLNYDGKFVQYASCDLAGDGSAHILHHALTHMGDVAYYCSSCHAIACAGCVIF